MCTIFTGFRTSRAFLRSKHVGEKRGNFEAFEKVINANQISSNIFSNHFQWKSQIFTPSQDIDTSVFNLNVLKYFLTVDSLPF